MDELLHYISIELANPFAAQKLGRKIFDKIELIRSFPDTDTLIDNEFVFDRTTRKLSVGNYVVYYKTDYEERTIFILRIVYSKRNPDEIFKTI